MLEWRVEEQGAAAPPPAPPGRRTGLRGLALLALLALLLPLLWLRRAEAQRAADVRRAVLSEEAALRAGSSEAAPLLADPAAPAGWQHCYRALFDHPHPLPAPRVVALQLNQGAAVTLRYALPGGAWQEQRHYRWGAGQWRRSPGARGALPAATLAPLDLARFQHHLEAVWGLPPTPAPELWRLPRPHAPPVLGQRRGTLCLNDAALLGAAASAPLAPEAAYRLAVAEGWLRAQATAAATPPSRDWAALMAMVQGAEARRWALSEAEQQALLAQWRGWVGPQWADPFAGALPLSPPMDDPAARRRWAIAALIIERRVAIGSDDAAARLAAALLAHDPATFEAGPFFLALVGGSPSNLRQLFEQHVTTHN